MENLLLLNGEMNAQRSRYNFKHDLTKSQPQLIKSEKGKSNY